MEANRLYGELAPWWPLISPVGDYEAEAAEVARALRRAQRPVRTVLELASRGGHNAYRLKRDFRLTLSDPSEPMLAVSRALNPECAHLAVGIDQTGRTVSELVAQHARLLLTGATGFSS